MNQLNDLRQKEAVLSKNQRDIEADGDKIKYLKNELQQAIQERDQLEETHRALQQNDFFSKQKSDNSWTDVKQKEENVTKKEIELKRTKDAIQKHEKLLKTLENDIREEQKQKDFYSGKIREMKNVDYQTDIDIDKIREKLLAEDVNAQSESYNFFRKFIKDMGYSGEEISNLDVDTLDDSQVRLDMLPMPQQVEKLERRRNEMKEKKKVLCIQLQRQQDLLKNTVYKN